MVGTNEKLIFKETINLLENKNYYDKMSKLHNPYGDGFASKKIVDFINSIVDD